MWNLQDSTASEKQGTGPVRYFWHNCDKSDLFFFFKLLGLFPASWFILSGENVRGAAVSASPENSRTSTLGLMVDTVTGTDGEPGDEGEEEREREKEGGEDTN